MTLPAAVTLVEVGPREGFQYEGIGRPDHIPTDAKIRLIDRLSATGLQALQIASFVSPRQVPQMADAEAVCAGISRRPGVTYNAIYLNDVGLRRAIATGILNIKGKITLAMSETFARRNQKRDLAQDDAMQVLMAQTYREAGIAVDYGALTAAFGCNDEGAIPIARVLAAAVRLHEIAAATGGRLRTLNLADTMGWGDPQTVDQVVTALRSRWPDLRIALHLHDTRGLAIANLHAGLLAGVDLFDTAVGGLGGCPFAANQGAAGNVCTEEVVFLCDRLGIRTGIDLAAVVECARLAEEMAGHPLPSKLLSASLAPRAVASNIQSVGFI